MIREIENGRLDGTFSDYQPPMPVVISKKSEPDLSSFTVDELIERCIPIRGKLQPTMFLPGGRRIVARARHRIKRPYFVVNPRPENGKDAIVIYLKLEKS